MFLLISPENLLVKVAFRGELSKRADSQNTPCIGPSGHIFITLEKPLRVLQVSFRNTARFCSSPAANMLVAPAFSDPADMPVTTFQAVVPGGRDWMSPMRAPAW
jgi:hypothetical protein